MNAVVSIHQGVTQTGELPSKTFADVHLDLEGELVRSYIADGDVVEGNLVLRTGVRIAGVVRGNVRCESGAIVVEQSGVVHGSLSGEGRILVDGTVNPDGSMGEGSASAVQIRSPGMIAFFNNARVNADVEYGRLLTLDAMEHNGFSKRLAAQTRVG